MRAIPIGAQSNGRAQELLVAADLPRRVVEVEEDLDLRPQQVRVVRLEDVVDRAGLVAAVDVVALLGDRRDEDDRDVARLLAALDVLGGLEAVELGHLDVEQDERELVVQQPAQRLLARRDADQAARQRLEHGLERQQVLRPVVDEQDVRQLARHAHTSRMRCGIASSGSTSSGPAASAARGISGRSAVAGSCTMA
jgi:hypothetical protein